MSSDDLFRRDRPSKALQRTGGPLKPGFGLSGAVRRLDKVFPPLVRVFVPSIPTRSRLAPHSRSRSGENCSTPSPPDVRTTQPSPDCDEYSAASPQTPHLDPSASLGISAAG